MKLLNIDANAKTVKGQKKGYKTAILYLAPADLSGYEVCPMRSKGCTKACLNTAGRGRMTKTQEARIRKTKMFMENRSEFMLLLEKEIETHIRRAVKNGFVPTVRLNGTSDIPWENISYVGSDGKKHKSIIHRFPKIQFYDYTKRPSRKNAPKNYHLTFSLAEDNDKLAKRAASNGMNIAVVFDELPDKFWSMKVVDGDDTDLRFKDGKNKVVGLKAKGKAKKDNSGFVRRLRVVADN